MCVYVSSCELDCIVNIGRKQGGEAVDLALARCEHVRDEVEKRQRTEWHAPGWAAAWTATWAASNIAGTHPMTLYGSEV